MTRFALALLLVLSAIPARAQDPNYDTSRQVKAPLPPSVSISQVPMWLGVPGTQVSVLPQDQRLSFDILTLANQFYLYNEGSWYRAELLNGPYTAIAPEQVPPDFRMVPASYWVHYPAGWDESQAIVNAGADTVWTPPARFDSVPNWRLVPGSSRVYWISGSKKPSYDLFRSTSKYYTFQNGNWYMATKVNGPYKLIDSSKVPSSFKSVKEKYWVSYPAGWKK